MKGRVIVVGAGIGGLSAAIHLAVGGRQVTVLERDEQVGGKMGELRRDGYRWDTGPTVITLRDVVEDLFATAGRQAEEYVDLQPLEPLTRYFYPDGTALDISSNLARTLEGVSALDPRDVDGYLRFLAYAARLYRITAPVGILGDPPGLRSALQVPLADLPHVDFVRSIHGAICAHVRSPHLRQLLGRYATYLGASPYRARAMFNVIAHVELTAGLWYPRGGTYAIARAYRRLAEELGVEIRTRAPVARIVVQDGAAVGVKLADGTVERAGVIVSNVDVIRTYSELLPSEPALARRLRRWLRAPLSCSGFLLLLGVEGQHPQLAHHNIFFSSDYRREFADIFRQHVPPSEPTIYVAITAKSDPQHAPAGGENWFVMVNVPPVGPAWDWAAQAQGYRDRVLTRLADLGIDVRGRIRVEQVITPLDLASQSGAWRGALYGLSFNHPLAPLIRPHNRSSDVRGLYFAGGTAHPAGGVPLVTLSGKTAARMILEDDLG